MLLIDRVGGEEEHAHGSAGGVLSKDEKSTSTKTVSAMIGLMVHAAIDGIALGATTFAGNAQTSLLVFAAIMLHKGLFKPPSSCTV